MLGRLVALQRSRGRGYAMLVALQTHCVERHVRSAAQERGIENSYTLAYQSRVGPVEWLKPYTDETIRRLGAQVRSHLSSLNACACPESFARRKRLRNRLCCGCVEPVQPRALLRWWCSGGKSVCHR